MSTSTSRLLLLNNLSYLQFHSINHLFIILLYCPICRIFILEFNNKDSKIKKVILVKDFPVYNYNF